MAKEMLPNAKTAEDKSMFRTLYGNAVWQLTNAYIYSGNTNAARQSLNEQAHSGIKLNEGLPEALRAMAQTISK